MSLTDTFLAKVKYEKAEYIKQMDRDPFNGDFEITLALLKESLLFNFGFFSQILTGFTNQTQLTTLMKQN